MVILSRKVASAYDWNYFEQSLDKLNTPFFICNVTSVGQALIRVRGELEREGTINERQRGARLSAEFEAEAAKIRSPAGIPAASRVSWYFQLDDKCKEME